MPEKYIFRLEQLMILLKSSLIEKDKVPSPLGDNFSFFSGSYKPHLIARIKISEGPNLIPLLRSTLKHRNIKGY